MKHAACAVHLQDGSQNNSPMFAKDKSWHIFQNMCYVLNLKSEDHFTLEKNIHTFTAAN